MKTNLHNIRNTYLHSVGVRGKSMRVTSNRTNTNIPKI